MGRINPPEWRSQLGFLGATWGAEPKMPAHKPRRVDRGLGKLGKAKVKSSAEAGGGLSAVVATFVPKPWPLNRKFNH